MLSTLKSELGDLSTLRRTDKVKGNNVNINAKNISTLIHFMDGLNDPEFSMERFGHDCKTPACALGWACKVPALQDAGLDFRTIYAGGTPCTDMSDRVFGDVYLALFASIGASGRIKTPKEWAAHAREYLARHGFEVTQPTPADDGFKAFMQSVLQTVALEETVATK